MPPVKNNIQIKKLNHQSWLVFDLDGTLYQFRGGSYRNSELKKIVMKNAIDFISNKVGVSPQDARAILKQILIDYHEDISVAVEEKYNISRHDYFQTVWNIPAIGLVVYNRQTEKIINRLAKDFNLILVSDAPQVWVESVLAVLKIKKVFADRIFFGEGNIRKNLDNAFPFILEKFKINPSQCVVIGDQESTDIVPAKKLGLKTVLINQTDLATEADYKISDLSELPDILKSLI